MVDTDQIPYLTCDIEDDVWVGHNAAIAPSARRVGRGAIVAAGAVVTADVEPYTIVAGVPARLVRRRFDGDVIQRIEALRWWEWDLDRLRQEMQTKPEMVYRPSDYFAASK